MATPLMWKALQLSRDIFDPLLYPHVLTPNPFTEQFIIETRFKQLIRFHISSCVLTFNLFCMFHFLGRNHFDPNFQYGHLSLFYAGLAGCIMLHLSLTANNLLYGHEMFECENRAIILEREVLGDQMKPLAYAANINHAKLLILEIRKLVRNDPKADKLGLVMYGLAAILSLLGIFFGFAGTYYSFDPGYYFFDYMFHPIQSQSSTIKLATYIVRYVGTMWSVMEAARSYILILIAAMSYCNMLVNCLQTVAQIPCSEKTIQEYTKVQYVTQVGKDSVKNLAGLLMGAGFVICVCGNWLAVFGWEIIPIEVNISMCLVTLVVYLVIHETLPMATKCHEFSKQMVKSWKYEYVKMHGFFINATSNLHRKNIRIWRRIVRAQQPITIYWATTKFKRETHVNYYSNIIDYTVDTLLGSAATKTS